MITYEKIEIAYLKIFKIIILIILTIALIASVAMAVKGFLNYLESPRSPPPPQTTNESTINIEDFIEQLAPKKEEIKQPLENKIIQKQFKDSPLDIMVDTHVLKLWDYFDGYQNACNASIKVDKDTFFNGFPKGVMKDWFRIWGEDFAESQDKFIMSVLSHKTVINYCIKEAGKGGIFYRSLDWHKDQYKQQTIKTKLFEDAENKRINQSNLEEEQRIIESHQEAHESLIMSLTAFGIFMGLALLLIFSKIESNLRNPSVNRIP